MFLVHEEMKEKHENLEKRLNELGAKKNIEI